MSEKTATEITIEPDNHTLENIKWCAEVENKTIEEVAKSYLVTGAINESLSEVVQTEIELNYQSAKVEVLEMQKTILHSLLAINQRIDKLELLIDKILEKFD